MTWFLGAAIGIISLCLVAVLVLILRTRDIPSRAVLADMIFYCMISTYLLWTFTNDASIAYEIAVLGGLLGLLSTVSMARILSKGRR